MKDVLKKEMMETIASQVYRLLKEGIEIRELKSQITSFLEKLDGYLLTITHLQQIIVDRPKKLVYCHEFMY